MSREVEDGPGEDGDKVTKSVDHGGLTNHLASRESNPEAPQTSRSSQVARLMSSESEAPHTKTRTQQPTTGQRKRCRKCRMRQRGR